MRRRATIVLACFAATCILESTLVHGMAGILKTPNISIPVSSDGIHDPVCTGIQRVLRKHKSHFDSGSFVNARSALRFKGTPEILNAMLNSLSKVDGVIIAVKFAKSSDVAIPPSGDRNVDLLDYDWEIEHNGWGQPNRVTIRINLVTMDIVDLELPEIHGIKDSTTE